MKKFLRLTLLFIFTILLNMAIPAFTHAIGFRMWETTSSPVSSSLGSTANAIAVSPPYIYVAGMFRDNTGDGKMRLEKRYMSNGELVRDFGINGAYEDNPSSYNGSWDNFNDIAIQCETTTCNVFLSGQYTIQTQLNLPTWRIEKVNAVGTALWRTNSSSAGMDSRSVAVDSVGNYVFSGGSIRGSYGVWAIQKARAIDGALCSAANCGTRFGNVTNWPEGYFIDQGKKESSIFDMAIDSNFIYSVGYQHSTESDASGEPSPGGYDQWRIDKRNVSDGSLVNSFYNGGTIIKDLTSGGARAYAIVVNGDYLYVAGYGNGAKIMKFNKTTGGAVSDFGDSGVITSDSNAWFKSIAISTDGKTIYAAGGKRVSGNDLEWFLEARDALSGSLLWRQEKNWSTTAGGEDIFGVATYAGGIYTAGYDKIAPNLEWRIEKTKENIETGDPIRAVHLNDLRAAVDYNFVHAPLVLPTTQINFGPEIQANQPIKMGDIRNIQLKLDEVLKYFGMGARLNTNLEEDDYVQDKTDTILKDRNITNTERAKKIINTENSLISADTFNAIDTFSEINKIRKDFNNEYPTKSIARNFSKSIARNFCYDQYPGLIYERKETATSSLGRIYVAGRNPKNNWGVNCDTWESTDPYNWFPWSEGNGLSTKDNYAGGAFGKRLLYEFDWRQTSASYLNVVLYVQNYKDWDNLDCGGDGQYIAKWTSGYFLACNTPQRIDRYISPDQKVEFANAYDCMAHGAVGSVRACAMVGISWGPPDYFK